MEADKVARQADPLEAPTMRRRTAEVDHKLHRLRLQVIFLLLLGVGGNLIFGLYLQREARLYRVDRYLACVSRTVEIQTWNMQLPADVPPYPTPTCPADPR